jgi:hypothetical protein
MDLTLPKEILQSLPAPDDEGLVRVTAALKIDPDGGAEIVSINDKPLPTDSEDSSGDGGDDASPAANLPSASEMDLGDGY